MAVSSEKDGTRICHEPVARRKNGQLLKASNPKTIQHNNEQIIIESKLEIVDRMLPSVLKFLVLRLLGLSFFRSIKFVNLTKIFLVKLLITRRGKSLGVVSRKIDLKNATAEDVLLTSCHNDTVLVTNLRNFSPAHMASQGYWQRIDDTTLKS